MATEKTKKEWYQSITLQANLATFFGAASALFSGEMSKETALSAMVLSIVNVILRIKTKSAIGG